MPALAVPLLPSVIVAVRLYTPPRTYMVSPAFTTDTALSIDLKGLAIVPVFESDPVVAT